MQRFLATGLPVQLFIVAEVQSRPESEASGSLKQWEEGFLGLGLE